MALARALTAAVEDPTPARLDVCELLNSAISEIDAPHVRFMHVLSAAIPLPRLPARRSNDVKYGMSLSQVSSRDPGLEEGGYAILQKLPSLGITESTLNGVIYGDENRPYALSPFGRKLLAMLRDEPLPSTGA